MHDRSTEIARALTARDGVDPFGDEADMVLALVKRCPGASVDEIFQGYEIARELSVIEAVTAPPTRNVQVFFGESLLAWRCTDADLQWLAESGRRLRVRPAHASEVWALGKGVSSDLKPLALIRADGATIVCGCRDPDPLLIATNKVLHAMLDNEIDAAISGLRRGRRGVEWRASTGDRRAVGPSHG